MKPQEELKLNFWCKWKVKKFLYHLIFIIDIKIGLHVLNKIIKIKYRCRS